MLEVSSSSWGVPNSWMVDFMEKSQWMRTRASPAKRRPPWVAGESVSCLGQATWVISIGGDVMGCEDAGYPMAYPWAIRDEPRGPICSRYFWPWSHGGDQSQRVWPSHTLWCRWAALNWPSIHDGHQKSGGLQFDGLNLYVPRGVPKIGNLNLGGDVAKYMGFTMTLRPFKSGKWGFEPWDFVLLAACFLHKPIWRFPEIGVPPNHQF